MPLRTVSCVFLLVAALAAVGSAPLVRASGTAELLPDLIAWAHDASEDGTPPSADIIHGGFFDTTVAGQVRYRFRVAIANVGDGPLQVVEQTDEVDGVKTTQTITQQILLDGTSEFRDEPIGTFPYPPEVFGGFGHLRLPGLAQYNLYEAVGNGGPTPDVGPLAATNDKLSMGIVDSIQYNQPVPGAPTSRVYNGAGAPVLGISVGYADLYGAGLPGQWIDVTGLASGQYFLEVKIDPYNRVLESDDTNNSTSILVDLTVPSPRPVGDFNGDGLVNLADYTVWRDTLGQVVAPGTAADGDGDGAITPLDYTVWKDHFGPPTPAAAIALASVPEPSSVLPLSLLGAIMLWAMPSVRPAR